jgi:phage terminase large subunit
MLDIRARAELALRQRRAITGANRDQKIREWQVDPLKYFYERLGVKPSTINWAVHPEYANHVWDGTPNPLVAILDALVQHKYCGVESATGTGKTFLGALIVFWFLECWENSLVITTAPKQDQLELNMWKWVEYYHKQFARGTLTNLKLSLSGKDDYWIAKGFVAGVKADESSTTKAQGFHAEHMLIIIEETPGVPLPTINAFQNTCSSPHNLILAFGNPDHQLDNLHQFCRQEGVVHVRISALDHPNIVTNNPNLIPGAVSQMGIQRIRIKFGDDSPITLSRTRGISPDEAIDALIKVAWCLKAVENRTIDLEAEKAIGVDVANSENGDKASIAIGQGNICTKVEDFRCEDANQLGYMVHRIVMEERIPVRRIGVDGIGVGAGTVNTLKSLGLKAKSINIQGAAKPIKMDQEEKFQNLRSQMWWQCREDLRNGEIGMPNDTELIADLTMPKYEVNNGKIMIETKENIKKRLGRSPNKGDSFVYWNWVRQEKHTRRELKPARRL